MTGFLRHIVKGIYFSWTNDPPNPKIKDWNVTELKVGLIPRYPCLRVIVLSMVLWQIDPHRRHVDKSVVASFWKILDQWTSTHKPSLVQG